MRFRLPARASLRVVVAFAVLFAFFVGEAPERVLRADAEEVAAGFGWEPIAAQTADLYRSLVPAPEARGAGEATGNPSGR